MAYLVHSESDRQAMLAAIGVGSIEELLVDIPAELRLENLDLEAGLPESEAMARIRGLAAANTMFEDRLTFRGGGVYRRFIPAAVNAVISKPEFYTAYTPYQPEASQGWLQAMFEFQSLICELTGLEVANSSLYDGATAVAEAAMMAAVQTGRHKVLVAGHLHPEYVEVLRTYGAGRGFEMFHVLHSSGVVDPGHLDGLDGETAAVIFQQPDFLGLIEDAGAIVEAAHAAGALAIACVDPISLGLLKPPGAYGADIAVGEGQQLGLAPSFGGPHLGFIATRNELVRRLPGRLVGEAHDALGRRGFVLTLTAREQHIRREKATSNICTNHALCALAASVYLTYLGPDGLRQVADVSFRRAHALAEKLAAIDGFELAFADAPFLNEFPVRIRELDGVMRRLQDRGVLGGLPLGRWYPELGDVATFCCTELNDPRSLTELVDALAPAGVEHR